LKTFRQALHGNLPTITAELAGPTDRSASETCRLARDLAESVDAVQLSERSTSAAVSPLALSALLLREQIDPLSRLNFRNRNRIALLSDLLGLRALGVSSILLEEEVEPNSLPVTDVDLRELTTMASELNDEDGAGNAQGFLVGTSVEVPREFSEIDAANLSALAAAGLRFLQIRTGFDMKALRRYLEHLVGRRLTWRCSIVVSVDLREGIYECARQIREVVSIPGISGVNLLVTGDPAAAREAIAKSEIRG